MLEAISRGRELLARRLALYGRNPRRMVDRLRYWIWERRHPHEPWLTPGAVAFMARTLRADMVGLEWGSGRSTRWYAQRAARLISIEHSAEWHAQVKTQLVAAGASNVEYRHVPLDHPEHVATTLHYDSLPRYVAVANELPDASLDFVIIDGHYRQACARAVAPKVKPGGLVLIDDTSRLPDLAAWGIPSDWSVAHHSSNGLKTTTVWQKPGAVG